MCAEEILNKSFDMGSFCLFQVLAKTFIVVEEIFPLVFRSKNLFKGKFFLLDQILECWLIDELI